MIEWVKSIKEEIYSASGWKLLLKAFLMLFAIIGSYHTFLTYHSERIEKKQERSELSFYRFIDDFGSSSERIRMGAISNIPNLMIRRVPVKAELNFFDSLKLLFGFPVKSSPIYHNEIKKLFYKYIKEFTPENKNWSLNEINLIINTLINLGPEVWYYSIPRKNITKREEGLKWLWEARAYNEEDITMANLFNSLKLDSVDLSNFDLTNSNLIRTSLKNATLKRALIMGAKVYDSNLEYATLDFARLSNNQFERNEFIRTSLYHSKIEYCNFKKSNLTRSDFMDAIIDNSIFSTAILNDVFFLRGTITNCDFSDSKLERADFSNCKDISYVRFNNSIMTSAIFSNSPINNSSFRLTTLENADFSKCKLKDTIFEGAYLFGAYFGGIQGIEFANWMDANISGIKGLSKEQQEYLLSKGAVIIPNKNKWLEYKKNGRPHLDWKSYS